MWSDLKQDEKFDLIKDYVRRGFHNLDDIMNDYNSSMSAEDYNKLIPEGSKSGPLQDVLKEMYNEWYTQPQWPEDPGDLDEW